MFHASPESRSVVIVAIAIILAACGVQTATAAEEPTDDLRFNLGLYGWLENFGGDLKSPVGTDHDFTIPFSEIFDRLEAVLEVTAEIGYRQWFLGFDGMWAKLQGGSQGDAFDLDIEYQQTIVDIHAGYGLYRHARSVATAPTKKPWLRVSAVDVILGARYFGDQTTLTETTHLTSRTHQTDIDSSRWDPLVGAHGIYSLSNRWAANLTADIGGFGIGDAADLTYQVDANIAFRISYPLAVFLGYRVLSYRIDKDHGGSATTTQYGPKMGVALDF